MKTWYRAACDQHKEMCHVLVSGTFSTYNFTSNYLEKYDKEIHDWLDKHSNCKLRLIHSDEDNEPLYKVYQDFPTPIASFPVQETKGEK